jgi:N-acetylmuramoyl-L-alanine amidase
LQTIIEICMGAQGSMLNGQKIFHKAFAPVSPVFELRTESSLRGARRFTAALTVAIFCALAPVASYAAPEADNTATMKRQAASSQFLRAEEQRSALNNKAPEKRTLAEYKQAVASYHRVTLITPRAAEVPDSLLAIAELYTEMGDRFGRSYYQMAVDSYDFLVREYPTSKYCQDSLLRAAKLQRDQLGDMAAATKTYDSFVKRFPRSPRKREAQEGMAEIALLQNSGQRESAGTTVAPAKNVPPANRAASMNEEPAEAAANAKDYAAATSTTTLPRSAPPTTMTRNVTMPDGDARDELRNVGRTDVHGDIQSGGSQSSDLPYAPRVRRIRASSSSNGDSARIIIDLEGSVQYSSARINNPERIFFDLHEARLTPEVARGNIQVDGRLLTAVRVAQNQAGVVRVVLDVNGVKDYTASLSSNPPQLIVDLYGTLPGTTPVTVAQATAGAQASGAGQDGAARSTRSKHDARMPAPVPVPAEDMRANTSGDYGTSADIASDGTVAPAVKNPVSATAPTRSSATVATLPNGQAAYSTTTTAIDNGAMNEKSQRSKSLKATNASGKPDLVRPASVPLATRDGQSTLTRTLGLKIGRIVIDAGHGGHDTGTIGPTGLMEKDLCLDVALRLGKIVEQKLPGAEVVYTRSDDTFIPLEERTNIANLAKADLFISIHANSSPDHAARGIETYYLNLRGSPEAMEVAARENATSAEGIHDLQDVVRQIARTEKIDESKEFAEDVQDSLSKRIQRSAKTVKNRGVHKAPFVVLIGADMPSILTEISFLSNPADEQLLKRPEQRQHVAEGIFSGVSSYLESMNSVAFNQSGKPARPRAAAAMEQSSNQK